MRGLLGDAWVDLVLGSACVGCGRGGRVLCSGCRAALPRSAGPRWPDPTPPGLAPPYATGDYDGTLRALVLCHKEHRVLAATAPLGRLLARSVDAATAAAGPGADLTTLLVPVPSRGSATRSRGHDPTLAMTRVAARVAGEATARVRVARLLRLRPGVADQAGLDAEGRRANLAGSMACHTARLARLAERGGPVRVVICDDVLTTGATAREAQRALEAVGVPVAAVAVVAATRRLRISGSLWSQALSPGDRSD